MNPCFATITDKSDIITYVSRGKYIVRIFIMLLYHTHQHDCYNSSAFFEEEEAQILSRKHEKSVECLHAYVF